MTLKTANTGVLVLCLLPMWIFGPATQSAANEVPLPKVSVKPEVLEKLGQHGVDRIAFVKRYTYDANHYYSNDELSAGVNLAGAALAAGPIADQVKAVATAINNKNGYFHDRIFAGVLRAGGVPEFMEMTPEQVEAKRTAVFNERMKKMPELFAAIRKSLIMKAHPVEIVPLQNR